VTRHRAFSPFLPSSSPLSRSIGKETKEGFEGDNKKALLGEGGLDKQVERSWLWFTQAITPDLPRGRTVSYDEGDGDC